MVWSEMLSSKQPMPGVPKSPLAEAGAKKKSLEAAYTTDPPTCVSACGQVAISSSPILLYTTASFFSSP